MGTSVSPEEVNLPDRKPRTVDAQPEDPQERIEKAKRDEMVTNPEPQLGPEDAGFITSPNAKLVSQKLKYSPALPWWRNSVTRQRRLQVLSIALQQYRFFRGGQNLNRLLAGLIELLVSANNFSLTFELFYHGLTKILKEGKFIEGAKFIGKTPWQLSTSVVWLARGVLLTSIGFLFTLGGLMEVIYLFQNWFHLVLTYLITAAVLYTLYTLGYKYVEEFLAQTYKTLKKGIEESRADRRGPLPIEVKSVEVDIEDSTGMVYRIKSIDLDTSDDETAMGNTPEIIDTFDFGIEDEEENLSPHDSRLWQGEYSGGFASVNSPKGPRPTEYMGGASELARVVGDQSIDIGMEDKPSTAS